MTIPPGTTGDVRSQDAAENTFTPEGGIAPQIRRHYVACRHTPPADMRTSADLRPILHMPGSRPHLAQTDYVMRKFARPQ